MRKLSLRLGEAYMKKCVLLLLFFSIGISASSDVQNTKNFAYTGNVMCLDQELEKTTDARWQLNKQIYLAYQELMQTGAGSIYKIAEEKLSKYPSPDGPFGIIPEELYARKSEAFLRLRETEEFQKYYLPIAIKDEYYYLKIKALGLAIAFARSQPKLLYYGSEKQAMLAGIESMISPAGMRERFTGLYYDFGDGAFSDSTHDEIYENVKAELYEFIELNIR